MLQFAFAKLILHVAAVVRRGVMSQKLNVNPIWEYFSKVDNNASKAKCCACDKFLSLGSNKPAKQTIVMSILDLSSM